MDIKYLRTQHYTDTWQLMKAFTLNRTEDTPDELWLLQHHAVYTQGQAGKPEHILNQGPIPVVQSDRGGQVTYHGPGQLVAYVLMDIRRKNLGIRTLVAQLEQVIMKTLSEYTIDSNTQCGAPGVYVNDAKIASIGLRVKNGCTYHGISLNVDMDLTPFQNINPCGFAQMKMTQISDFNPAVTIEEANEFFVRNFLNQFSQ